MNLPQLRRAFERGRQVERDRLRRLVSGKQEEFRDHARQLHALPKAAATLELKGDALDDVLDLIGGDT